VPRDSDPGPLVLDEVPSFGRRLTFLAVGLVLLVLSRLPFLRSHPDWGIFDTEHIWMIDDSSAINQWLTAGAVPTASLGATVPQTYLEHYHGGALWATEAIRLVGLVTGDVGLLEMKLVGLLASIIALCCYGIGLFMVWPRQPVRWALPVAVAWLVPPTLLLWNTLMPMGHYLETWFFHAVFLPPLVLILSDRAGLKTLTALGIALGAATAYVASNVVFLLLCLVAYLLFSRRPLWERGLGSALLVTTGAMTARILLGARLDSLALRASTPSAAGETVLARLGRNLGDLFSRGAVADGSGWSQRGLWSALEPTPSPTATVAAYVLGFAALLGVVYLLRWTGVLAHPRRRELLGLPERLLATQGALLVMTVTAFLFAAQIDQPQAMVNYLAISYPPLLLGLGLGAAALLGDGRQRRRGGRVAVIALLGLLVVGWAQSGLLNARPLDRPDLRASGHSRLHSLFGLVDREPSRAAAASRFEELCRQVYPGNEAYCAVASWTGVLETAPLKSDSRFSVTDELCASAPEERAMDCAMAAGAHAYDPLFHPEAPDGLPSDIEEFCGERFPDAQLACISGGYRTGLRKAIEEVQRLCGTESGSWSGRACLEAGAFALTGMPVMPAATESPPSACRSWPTGWTGLCEQAARAQRAGEGEGSCEEVYRSRFVDEVPRQNSLVYDQCLRASLANWSFYPACVIGAAKALEGLSCSWRGTPLRL